MIARPVCLLLALAVAAVVAGPARAQGAKAKAPPPTETTELIRVLAESMETKDFTIPMSLREFIQLVGEKLAVRGKDVPMLMNTEAFRSAGIDPEAVTVKVGAMPKQLTIHALLEQMTSQVGATYLLRQGQVEIVPMDYATIENLLTQPLLARYEQRPLREVLQDLADRTGATIVLDGRAGEAGKEPISAIFRNNVTLEDALRICTEEAGLKFVILRNSILVTTAANARAIQQDQDAAPPPRPAAQKNAGAA